MSITLNYDTVAEAKKIFERLADGGKVTMAMAPTFWAKSFGMVTDKFGTHWIVNGELLPVVSAVCLRRPSRGAGHLNVRTAGNLALLTWLAAFAYAPLEL